MNELKQLWGEISQDEQLDLITSRSIAKNIRLKSASTISVLHRKITSKAWFCLGMSVLLVVAIPFVAVYAVQIMLSTILMAYTIAAILIYQELKIIKSHPDAAINLLAYLKSQIYIIEQILKYEALVALLLFPITGAAGFLLGMYWLEPNTAFLNEPLDWMILLGALIVLMPVCHLATQRINKSSFGDHLKHLMEMVEEMS